MEELSLVINQPDDGKFIQKIGWNKEQIMNAVAAITEQYEGLTYTEEQMKDAKKDRAALNAMRKAISGRRIEIKKALLAPYDVFDAEVKEVVALIDKPIAMIDEQTSEYEERIKEEKRQNLIAYFDKTVGELEGTLTFEMIFNQKWLNKTTSLKSCKEDIATAIQKTRSELKTIDEIVEEKYRAYAKDFYFRKNRDMTSVLDEIGRMRAIDKRAEEERIAKAEKEKREREAENKGVADPPSEPEKTQDELESRNPDEKAESLVVEESPKMYKASFTVYGTKSQIMNLKQYMNDNGIEFGKVE